MGRRSELVEKHTIRVGRANKSEFRVACIHCRNAGVESHFVSRTDAVVRHLNQCLYYKGPVPTLTLPPSSPTGELSVASDDSIYNGHGPAIGSSSPGTSGIKRIGSTGIINGDKIAKPSAGWTTKVERQILRTVISCGMPFAMAEDPEFRQLLTTICPPLRAHPELIPNRNTLASRVFMDADTELKDTISQHVRGCKWLTLTADSWINSSGRPIVAYVMRTPMAKSFAWEWEDTASVPNGVAAITAKKLLDIVHNSALIGKVSAVVVTDRARALADEGLVTAPPMSIGLKMIEDYDEEIQMMVADCLLSLQGMKEAMVISNDIVSLLMESEVRQTLLRNHQQELNEPITGFNYPITTQWSTTAEGLKTLLQSNQSVSRTLYSIGHDASLPEATRESTRILRESMDVPFLTLLHAASELVGALSSYQEESKALNGTRLRMILPAAQRIWIALEDSSNFATVTPDIAHVKMTLNKRLQSWDLDLLILATILDPNVKRWIFNKSLITPEMVVAMAEREFETLFDTPPSPSLTRSLLQYLEGAQWPFLESQQKINPLSLYSTYWGTLEKTEHYELVRLAQRLESCVVSAVDPERLFRDMGSIHAALRGEDSTGEARGNEILGQFLEHHEANFGRSKGPKDDRYTFEDLFSVDLGPLPLLESGLYN